MTDVDPLLAQVQVVISKDGVNNATTSMYAFLTQWQAQGYFLVSVRGGIGANIGGIYNGGTFVPQLEGMSLFCYGHSYLSENYENTSPANYINRLWARVRAHTLTTNAVTGSDVGSAAFRANGNGPYKYTPGTKGFVMVDALFVQMAWTGFTSQQAKNAFASSIRSLMAALSAASKVESSAMTLHGTWSTDTTGTTFWSGGSAAYTTTVGDYAEAVVTVNATGKVDVWTLGTDPTFPFPAGNFSISVDGVVVYNGNGQSMWQDTPATENQGYGPMAVTIAGLTPGNHTIRITKGAGASYLYVDCFLVRSVAPPPIAFAKHLPYVYTNYSGIYGRLITETERMNLNVLVDQIAAEFPNVITVDASPGWDPVGMVGPSGIHPNDKGMSYLADYYEQVLAQYLPWTGGMHSGMN